MGKIKDFILHEGKLVGLVTSYFLVCFGITGLLKTLTLHEYSVQTTEAGTAIIAALVIAKVVIVLDKTPAGNRFERHAVWSSVLYKTFIYTLTAALVLTAEKLFHAWREGHDGEGMAEVLHEALRASDGDRALATLVCLCVSFMGYNLLAEVGRTFGWDKLLRWLFTRHAVRGDFGRPLP
ncbi:MAG: hypothetical protein DRJ42_18750 [Deltaproteobacteria bacterium]|nr:MAG: hypothetical protein DRJ42_18750 [Deltaproteobacteria bacterium]